MLFAGAVAGFTLHTPAGCSLFANLKSGGIAESGGMARHAARVEISLFFQQGFKSERVSRRGPLEVFLFMASPACCRRHIPVLRLRF